MLDSATRSRYVRRAALVGVAGAGAATLVACQKPLPQITFQSGSRSVLASPTTQYCFDLDKTSCRAGNGSIKGLVAAPGSSINISVPRTVALNAWIVTATDVDDTGKTQVIDGAGSGVVSDNHFTRVQVPTQGSAPYLLTVAELRGNTPTGAWTIQVNITT